jgi:hypothetical protein
MAFTPEQAKEYREKMAEKGLCVRCHKAKAREGRRTCKPCIDKNYENKKARYKRNKDSGILICRWCYKNPQREGSCFCEACRDKALAAQSKLEARYRKDKWRCHRCWNPLDEFSTLAGRLVCPSCTEREAKARQRRGR